MRTEELHDFVIFFHMREYDHRVKNDNSEDRWLRDTEASLCQACATWWTGIVKAPSMVTSVYSTWAGFSSYFT